ncbi:hypothetical protein BOTBODRAFT_56282 [Botryobasidium botryosum FD-172 SS1]|uniref:BTB domain-containing protein n=1 Tax=Botryobasidium botryosum (strain FD-172 SS1) TaxID=930990 RepID=A0A067MBV4_BOTB1|nr:hypothetical protein BOTBODRAFT_56282 [Botryobasidium botryosum FD-172 SS1]
MPPFPVISPFIPPVAIPRGGLVAIKTARQNSPRPPSTSEMHKLAPAEEMAIKGSEKERDDLSARLADPLARVFDAQQPGFWFDDGNVIVCVEDRRFRIHSSNLSRRSQYFAELFAQEHGDHAERSNGCNVYRLNGRASDFAAILDAIYHNLLISEKEPSFFTLACLLRAAHHWDFPTFKRWVLASLEARWPPTLKNVHQQDGFTEFATRIIVLFRQCNETSLLKHAFYSVLSTNNISTSLQYHSTSHSNHLESDDPKYYYHDTPNWSVHDFKLSHEDLTLLLHLQHQVMQLWANFATKPPALDFLDRKECGHGREGCVTKISLHDWSHQVIQPYLHHGYFDPLCCLQSMKDSRIEWKSHTGVSICDSCRVGCEKHWEEECVQIWEQLIVN